MATAPTTDKPAKTKKENVTIEPLDIRFFDLTLVGDTPLIMNRFPEKAKTIIREKQAGAAKAGKTKREPKKDYEGAIYYMADGKQIGFPALAFKASAVRGAKAAGMKMVDMNTAFHIIGQPSDDGTMMLVPIEGKPKMVEHAVRNATGVCDLRYRAMFATWKTTFSIKYNARAVTMEQIIQFFELGGFGVGVGDWRAEKKGDCGLYHPL